MIDNRDEQKAKVMEVMDRWNEKSYYVSEKERHVSYINKLMDLNKDLDNKIYACIRRTEKKMSKNDNISADMEIGMLLKMIEELKETLYTNKETYLSEIKDMKL